MQMSQTSLDKSKIKFLLLEGVHQNAVDTLKAAGCTNIEYLKTALSGDELKERSPTPISSASARVPSSPRKSSTAPEADRRRLLLHRHQPGRPQRRPRARHRGVQRALFQHPFRGRTGAGRSHPAPARHPEKNASCHRGGWIKSAANSFEIRGKKLGIIGYGSIGTQLSVLAEALGMQVFFYDVVTKLPLGNATQIGSLYELLGMCDIVSLHVPELPSTQWMIGEKEIRAMKKGAILINAARGTVVELDHLAAAIKDEHLIGAAIDVFPVEPKSNDEEFESPLRGLDRVILTPHIGGSTAEAQANIGLEVAEKLVKYSDNGTSVSSVNFPEVALPSHPGKHRLLHIHQNIPGVMSEINRSSPTTASTSAASSCRPTRRSVTSSSTWTRILRPGAGKAAARQRHHPQSRAVLTLRSGRVKGRLRPPFSFPQPSLGTQRRASCAARGPAASTSLPGCSSTGSS